MRSCPSLDVEVRKSNPQSGDLPREEIEGLEEGEKEKENSSHPNWMDGEYDLTVP